MCTFDINNFKLFGMNKTANPMHSKSETGFILINGSSKTERPTRWEWLTQRNHLLHDQTQEQSLHPRLSYSEKKRVLSGLQTKLRSSSSFKIREGFSLKQKARIVSTASSGTLMSEKKYQPFVYLNSHQSQAGIPALNFGVDHSELRKRIGQAYQRHNRVLAVVSVRRLGLRYRLNHIFVEKCGKCGPTHKHELKSISDEVRLQMKQFGSHKKQLYYYSSKGLPVNTYEELLIQNVLIVDLHPKLGFSTEINWQVFDFVRKISQTIAEFSRQVWTEQKGNAALNSLVGLNKIGRPGQELYDHQRIKNVGQYVDKLSENPHFKLSSPLQTKNELSSWYDQRYTNQEGSLKEGEKNLLFQSKCHYPQEIVNRRMLGMASQKVEQLPKTTNRHKFVPERIELMMQQVRRQEATQTKHTNKAIPLQAAVTKRDMLARLDRKNSLLSTQNIPYLIERYGLNRFQIYNLYNLYKSFQKIAIMRSPNLHNTDQVAKKGIDRQTFEVGLKGLDMNPGDELIKNICHFGDFISWEQFIKIISISLRKTPEEKLSAILKGISSSDQGYLSKHQISLMIGNSLHKLFDHEQVQLKQYFTNMAMSEFDPNQTGEVEVEVLKNKVLNKGSQNLNMVSFLILNT